MIRKLIKECPVPLRREGRGTEDAPVAPLSPTIGPRAILPYKFIFVIFVFLGMVLPEFKPVYNFSDVTVALMVLCNLPAVLLLSPHVLRAAKHYFRRLDAGEMPRYK